MDSNKQSKAADTVPVDALVDLPVDQLRILEKQYEKEATERGRASPDTMLAYACGLVRSQYRDDRAFGIDLLLQIDRTHPDRHRDCAYFLSIGYYKQGELSRAKKLVGELLEMEPHNQQARDLERLIKKKMTQDGLVSLAIIGGAAAVFAGVVMFLSSPSRRS